MTVSDRPGGTLTPRDSIMVETEGGGTFGCAVVAGDFPHVLLVGSEGDRTMRHKLGSAQAARLADCLTEAARRAAEAEARASLEGGE